MANFRINAHGHLLPYPEQIPTFMKDRGIFWIDDDRQFMRQKGWSRPITDTSFFLTEKLDWMARNCIDHEVILNLSQLYANGLSKADAIDAIRFQNDFNASIQDQHPDKFSAGFVVQPAYVDDALREIERCVEERSLPLLCLPTHFSDERGRWHSVAHEQVEPIWQLADHYSLAVEVHPYDGPKFIALENIFWRFHLVWMCAQTADTYHLFTTLDYPDRYPNIRTCFAHGNQFGQINIGRRMQGYMGRPDLFERGRAPDVHVGNKAVFFDTLVHDTAALRLLVERQGVDQIVAGLDDPYPLGEMEGVQGCYPGKVIQEAMDQGVITTDDGKRIWFDNVVRWLAGPKSDAFLSRLEIPEIA